MMPKILIVSLGLLATSLTVEARICYQCTSTNDGPCFNPGEKNVSTVTCSPSNEEFSCSTTSIIQENDVTIKRDCLRSVLTDQFCAEFEDEGVTGQNKYLMGECLVCDDELCNSSNRITLFGFISVVMSPLILYKLC